MGHSKGSVNYKYYAYNFDVKKVNIKTTINAVYLEFLVYI